MATDDSSIAGILDLIASLEKEAADAKRTVNRMLIRSGQPARFNDAELNADGTTRANQIRKDQFYKKALASSIREYLQMRYDAGNGPATLQEIYDAMVRGGMLFETDNEDNRKRNLRLSLTKNTAIFHKLPTNGDYTLREWYPDLKAGDEEPTAKKKKKAKGKKNGKGKPQTQPEKKAEKAQPAPKESDGPVTLLDAVRAAILAKGEEEFTKQAIVDWIAKKHPVLKAETRKTSIFSMIATLKDELNLVTAFAGKGKEPHRYKREVK